MKTLKLALVAAVVASSIIPMLSTAADARVRLYNRIYNRAYTPYGYGYGYGYPSQYQINQANANAFINQVNSMIQSGQITVQQGNAMLVQGRM